MKKFCQYLLDHDYIIYLKTPECFTVKAKNINGEKADFVLAKIQENQSVSGSLYDDLARRDFSINAMKL